MEQRRGRRHLGEAAWAELLRRFDEGEETIEAFCEREGVSKSTFNRWRSRRGLGHTGASPVVRVEGREGVQRTGFVDLGALCSQPGSAGRLELTLELGGGVTLRVARG